MTSAKFREVVHRYREYFEKEGIGKRKVEDYEKLPASDAEILEHLHAMLDQMEAFVEEERYEKFCRWLGFIQGSLWSLRKFPLEELKNHNRP